MTKLTCFATIWTLGILLLLSCNQQPTGKSTAEANSEVATLLDRHPALRNGVEWDKVQNAYGTARAAVQQNPDDAKSWLLLAEVFMQEARVTGEHPYYYPAALKAVEKVLEKPFSEGNPKDQDLKFQALSLKAGVEMSLHQFDKAFQTAQEAVAINPYNAAIYGVLTDACVELGHYDEAVDFADKMVGIRPDLRSYSRVSYLREIYGDLPGAIEAMKLAVSAGYPGSEQAAWAKLNLGHLYEKTGDFDKARETFESILNERPDYPFAIAALGNLALQQNDYQTAEKLLNRAIEIAPEVGFYENLARLYKQTGRMEEFDKTFETIIAMMNEDAEAGHVMDLEMAKVYLELKEDPKLALQYARKEYELRPQNKDVNAVMAQIFQKAGQPEEAAKYAAAAVVSNRSKG
ncbi:MAG: hypothetical protein D6816_12820 [Bacteroidetes bacterium]|nr:MAG: hypothetical protein D6816_12820 [Bacteroidota bacterium]